MCIAVGNVSLDDCDLLTSSLALINNSPSIFPNLLNWALLAITSLTFILDWVPELVCQITKGNSSSNFPSEISSQTVAIASRFSTGSVPNSQLVYAAAFFKTAKALIISLGIEAGAPILKFSKERSVCAPQNRSAGTFTSPIVSFSILYSILILFILSLNKGTKKNHRRKR